MMRHINSIAFFLLLVLGSPGAADIVKDGEACIPGHDGKIVKWRVAHSKSPYGNPVGAKSVHFWMDLELKDPEPGDDIRFIVCCMLNVNKPKINMPSFKAIISGGTWSCSNVGIENWYPNYHFGCRGVRLHAGNGWKLNAFDETVEFSVEFTEAEMASPYFDLAVDCPNGFSGCGPLFGATDQFLTPGDGTFPQRPPCEGSGTSSWWVYNGGSFLVNPQTKSARAPFATGNWFTMAVPDNVYVAELVGTLTNAPQGALLEISFPPSAGAEPFQLEIAEDSVELAIPFEVTPEIINDEDEHTYFQLTYPADVLPPDPDSVIEFLGQVNALNDTFFPDGGLIFAAGDFMHGIHLQFADEKDEPFVVEGLSRQVNATDIEIFVAAADDTTMATGATVSYSVNGVAMPDVPLPYDVPAAEEETTFFRGRLGPFQADDEIEYAIRLVDDAMNMSVSPVESLRIEAVGLILAGDCNRDGSRNISDILCLVHSQFPGFLLLDRREPELPCGSDAGNLTVLDLNGDDVTDVSDIAYLANLLFSSGPSPVQGAGCLAARDCPEVCPE